MISETPRKNQRHDGIRTALVESDVGPCRAHTFFIRLFCHYLRRHMVSDQRSS